MLVRIKRKKRRYMGANVPSIQPTVFHSITVEGSGPITIDGSGPLTVTA